METPLCSFAEVGFDVEGADDPFFVLPSIGINDPPSITLPILLYSRANAQALYDYRTRATVRTSLQNFTGVAVIHAGKGARTLNLPTGLNGALQAYSAILTNLVIAVHEFDSSFYRATATWLILSDPLP